MKYITTLTTKGQVVIPKRIREVFNLHPSDKIHFKIEDGKIIAEPVKDVNEVFGMFKTNKKITKKKRKEILKKRVEKKYK